MRSSLPLIALAGLSGLAFHSTLESAGFSQALEEVSEEASSEARALAGLEARIAALDKALQRSEEEIVQLSKGHSRSDALRRELTLADSDLECRLAEAHQTIRVQEARLADFESRSANLTPEALQSRFDRLAASVREDWTSLEDTLWSTRSIADEHERDLSLLRQRVERNTGDMWQDMMGPVVQLAGDSTVGSGILLASVPQEDDGVFETHLLTAWHVVRDILADDQLANGPIPVAIYQPSGDSTPHTAKLLQFDAGLDVALLKLVSTANHGAGARLPSRESLAKKSVFDPVYAVGCPLGNDPIPTRGEISDLHHSVDQDNYWMISAPSYIGNSGGAIFDAESRELLGVFSKIYTHGTLRPTVVPHMGLATPLAAIYDWLERVGYASVAEQTGAVQAKVASAKR